jgi:chromatin remodeling complex protein RSC6
MSSTSTSVVAPAVAPAVSLAVADAPAAVAPAAVAPAVVEEKKIVLDDEPAPKKKTRRVITLESVQAHFAKTQKMIEEQIEFLRRQEQPKGGGAKGIKFLKSVCKQVKDAAKDVARLYNTKTKRPKRAGTTISGFCKPVRIATKMCEFAGWKDNEEHSRIDVTKAICAYVKEKGLQNPANKREIMADEKLRNLLDYDPATNPTPLTYFSLQKMIQPLFPDSKSQVALREKAAQAQNGLVAPPAAQAPVQA